MKRKILNKSDIIEILLISCILLVGLSTILYYHSKNTQKKYSRVNTVVNDIAYKLRDMRIEESILKNKIKESEFYNYIEKVYEVTDKDFFNIISIIYKKANENNIDPFLLIAIIQHESDFNPSAQSFCAYGLMQINYDAWKEDLQIDKKRIFDPEYNIDLGIIIYKYYLKRANNNVNLALFYYNNGEDMPKNKANYGYSKKILNSNYLNIKK